MEGIKSSLTLTSSSLGSPESMQSTSGIIFRLLPNFPLGTLLAIDLLQAEVLPIDI